MCIYIFVMLCETQNKYICGKKVNALSFLLVKTID